MYKKVWKSLILSGACFAAFILFTLMLKFVDVQAIGPEGSEVGFATINAAFAKLTGVNPVWKTVSEYLGYICFATAGVYVVYLIIQFIRKHAQLKEMDQDVLALAAMFILVMITYIFFEVVIVNYRPVILDPVEGLEASYPSSHTLISCFVMHSTMIVFTRKIHRFEYKSVIAIVAIIIAVLTFISRLVSGVHWLTDVLGAKLIAASFIFLYNAALNYIDVRNAKRIPVARIDQM